MSSIVKPIRSDGPLTRAVREGALCYLDEVVEARQDTMVVLHSLTDHRRFLPIDVSPLSDDESLVGAMRDLVDASFV